LPKAKSSLSTDEHRNTRDEKFIGPDSRC